MPAHGAGGAGRQRPQAAGGGRGLQLHPEGRCVCGGHFHQVQPDHCQPARTNARRAATLTVRIVELPPPPNARHAFPRHTGLKARLLRALEGDDGEEIEERFLELYAHLHMHEAPYTSAERARVDETGGYWCHAGGLSPILKAAPWLGPESTSADLGAGNGLQCLLLQRLYPHRRTTQIEISERMVEIGRSLQSWLEIPEERVRWVVGDVTRNLPEEVDFLYLYRPVRPEGTGRIFYEKLAAEIESWSRPTIVFSIADCLRSFVGDTLEVFYCGGHLTCFRHRPTT